jgi:DNA anti-recombination protein RmuC
MRTHTALLILVLVILIAFAAANYSTLTSPQLLNLIFVSFSAAPVGMILTITAIILSLLFALLTGVHDLQSRAESARGLREIANLRQSLDQAESSRIADLRAQLEKVLEGIDTRLSRLDQQWLAQSSSLANEMNDRVDQLRDRLAADLGELEDTILKKLGGGLGADGENR